jgi:hypothetical protein
VLWRHEDAGTLETNDLAYRRILLITCPQIFTGMLPKAFTIELNTAVSLKAIVFVAASLVHYFLGKAGSYQSGVSTGFHSGRIDLALSTNIRLGRKWMAEEKQSNLQL